MAMTAFGSSNKKMMNVLSIDWDVFHDMTQFMPGSMACEIDWVVEYSRLIDSFNYHYKFAYKEFEQIKEYLSRQNQIIYIAEDHKSLYKLVPFGVKVELYNLDFHSDLAVCENLNELDCGNWISALKHYNGCDVSVNWCQLHTKLADGDLSKFKDNYDLDISFVHQLGFAGILDRKYDIIFICQSYEYSPPHMNHKFRELVEVCKRPHIVKENEPIYHTHSGRVEYVSQFDRVYIPDGSETQDEMDAIYRGEELLVVHPSPEILYSLTDCDPIYRGEVKTGYSSHGIYATLSAILELETDRGNATVEDIQSFLREHPGYNHKLAIWVTYNAQDCFMYYGDGEEMTQGLEYSELSQLLKQSKEFVEIIDLTKMLLVCSDMQGGYLYVGD